MTFDIFFEQKIFFTSFFTKKRVFQFEEYLLKQFAADS